MFLLALSLAALSVGPWLAHVSKNRPRILEGLDGFVVVTITGIVAVHVIPHALADLGAWTIAALACGLVLPTWLERSRVGSAGRFSVEPLLVLGLAIHALLDGTALNTHDGHAHAGHGGHAGTGGSLLAIAVSLHRIPEGLAIWWIVVPKRGTRWGIVALTVVGAASCLGFLLSEELVELIPEAALVGMEALVAGSLLHVIAHHELSRKGSEPHSHDATRPHVHEGDALGSGLGALVGVSFLFVVTRQHPITYRVARELGFGTTLETLALASAPVLLAALVVSALLHAAFTGGREKLFAMRAGDRSRVLGALRGVVSGALLPICSCGVLSFYRRASGRLRTPSPTTLALLASAPEMEIASGLLTAVLIDPVFAVVRPLGMGIVGFVVGGVLGRQAPHAVDEAPTLDHARFDLKRGLRFALGETVEHTGPWIVFGLFVASLAEPFLDPLTIRAVPLAIMVPLLALFGMLVPMCASGVTPLLAVLVHKGLGPGAVLAFLVMAAAGNLRVLRLVLNLHGTALAARYGALLFALALSVGALGSFVWPTGLETPLHDVTAGSDSALRWLCLAALAVLLTAAVLRRGPRPLLQELVAAPRT